VKFVLPMAFSPPAEILPLARAAEHAGWDAVGVSDHLVHPATIRSPYPYTPDGAPRWPEMTPWPDPWVTIAAMAAVTTRLRYFTNVYVLPLRNPVQVAKTVGTAAVLSGDRVALGIGVGWMEDEFSVLGQDFATRGRRADEMIEVMRKLWTGERVEHHGRYYDFDPLRMLPAPGARVPIYVGGLSDAALRRAASLGDGWISDLHTSEELRTISAKLRTLRSAAGRAADPFELVAAPSDSFDADGYRRLEEHGVTTIAMMPWFLYGAAEGTLDQKIAAVRRFAIEVIAKSR